MTSRYKMLKIVVPGNAQVYQYTVTVLLFMGKRTQLKNMWDKKRINYIKIRKFYAAERTAQSLVKQLDSSNILS